MFLGPFTGFLGVFSNGQNQVASTCWAVGGTRSRQRRDPITIGRSLSQQDSTRQTKQQNNASISTRFDSAPDSSFNQAMRCEEMYRSNSETL